MHRSVGKITDENVLLFSSKTKCALHKAAIRHFNADNHVFSLSCGSKKVCTLVFPISHFETLLVFDLLDFLIYVMNITVIFQTY